MTSVVDSHPTALIVAPSGYGKTSAVAEWAAQHSGPLLWVTLGRFDANAARIDGMIAQALRSLAELHRGTPLELLRHLDPNCSDPATAFDTASQALAELDEPVRLVIDNAHIAREALTLGLLGALMDAELPQLRVVVVGTSYAELALSRLAVTRPQAVVRAYDLAFNTDEIAEFLRQQGCALDPVVVYNDSRGWPIAVNLIGVTGDEPTSDVGPSASAMESYLRDHVLASVPPDQAEFALATSVCDQMTPELAASVADTESAGDLLERCFRTGMPIDRYDSDCGPVYQWHSMFARLCRRILHTTHPARLERARRTAAEASEADRPLAAATLWLHAGLPAQAVRVLCSRWIGLVVGPHAKAVDELCTTLPAPWNVSSQVLAIRACAHEVLGEPELAHMLHAQALAAELPGVSQTGDCQRKCHAAMLRQNHSDSTRLGVE
ncbi:hypothetical protein [Gordonia sp. (in: high G+C Gram-positive bacteria)]|uniref:hypothetical protein n=1 Tax=Gordonia sp. (in: high G+C Gram-positive bacteria) TaxID=84139 RepID=UPI0016BD0CCD|nr:hypothetical protein [Gordonia sp. (in: high G+C Gram-positive bacteria)]NLG46261.1 hypothetical protein [Gordonia sp. (in: high G+C Gram-positive bacteria)]